VVLKALKEKKKSTFVVFELKKEKIVKFWVSDHDCSDNLGSEKVQIYSADKKEMRKTTP